MFKEMKCKFRLSFLFFLLSISLFGQRNASNMYMFDFIQQTDDYYEFSHPRFLTAFNSNGYNNQPFFISDKVLYFSSSRRKATQVDIYALNIQQRTKTQITSTPTDEYAPNLLPNRQFISCINVEANNHRLWKIPIDRSDVGSFLFSNESHIGYHLWIDEQYVALSIGDKPTSLGIGNMEDGTIKYITSNIGRCFQVLPNGNLVYLQKLGQSTWYIKGLDLNTGRANILIEAKNGQEDFIVLTDGTIIQGSGSRLYKYNSKLDNTWELLADLSIYGIDNIKRLAWNGDRKLVIVNEE